jgi:hypothetical protein
VEIKVYKRVFCGVVIMAFFSLEAMKSKVTYTREELLALRRCAESLQAPANLPHIPGLTLSVPGVITSEQTNSVVDQDKEALLQKCMELQCLSERVSYNEKNWPRHPVYTTTIRALRDLVGILECSEGAKKEHRRLCALQSKINNGLKRLCEDRRCSDWFKRDAHRVELLMEEVTNKESMKVIHGLYGYLMARNAAEKKSKQSSFLCNTDDDQDVFDILLNNYFEMLSEEVDS